MNGVFGSKDLIGGVSQSIFCCSAEGGSVVSLNVCNRGSSITYIDVAVSTSMNSPAASEWIEYGVEILPKGVLERTGITITQGQYLTVRSSRSNVSAMCWGVSTGTDVDVPTITANTDTTVPVWITSPTLSVYVGSTTNLSVSDLSPTLTYSLTSGSLPANVTLDTLSGSLITPDSTSGYIAGGVSATSTITVSDGTNSVPRTFNITKRWRDGTTAAAAAPNASYIKTLTGTSTSGYYWINPEGQGFYYIYCDMVSDGGGWMLMINARPNNGGQYYSNNAYGLSTINSVNNVPEFNKGTTSMHSREVINTFFQSPGFKYSRITPGSGVTLTAPYTGLYQRIGTTRNAKWGGNLFDASNRGNLTGEDYSWALVQYQNWSDCVNNTNSQTGTYTGGNHYYPTTYAGAYQNFWKGDQDGIRFSSQFRNEDYSSLGQNTSPGYFWIKVV